MGVGWGWTRGTPRFPQPTEVQLAEMGGESRWRTRVNLGCPWGAWEGEVEWATFVHLTEALGGNLRGIPPYGPLIDVPLPHPHTYHI